MTIADVGTLQTAVESWLERSLNDALFLEFANGVADKLMRGVMGPDGRTWISPPLRIRSMLAETAIVTTGAEGAIPADWMEFERLWIDTTDGGDLTYLPLLQFKSVAASQMTGTPKYYTIDGAAIFVAPTSDATLQASYYAGLGAFTGDASTDAVLIGHPRVYLAGCIAEACAWAGDYEREAREDAKFSAAVRALNAQDAQAQRGGSLLISRPQSVA